MLLHLLLMLLLLSLLLLLLLSLWRPCSRKGAPGALRPRKNRGKGGPCLCSWEEALLLLLLLLLLPQQRKKKKSRRSRIRDSRT